MSADNTVHVAYGFHVNLYHSYRGDSNDGLGFGSDIRIIRKIIDVLNELNERGVPVKGTWDFENFFSLEQILPQYAPDIIAGVKKRVERYGDENIIMGYNNGALSAMTDAEFAASIEWAVTNPAGSGLQDIFGTCERIVRPQEVMFTPSQVSLYRQCGVKAVCLYNSCIPFDAFATLIPPLPDEQAFNPLTYTYRGETLTVVPTYSNADVCDAGCLRAWVKALHARQVSGEIDRDLFLFINMDADAVVWESLDLPVVGSRIANTDGIRGLVTEVADLPFVVFDTVGGYLKNHGPVGEIAFGQDTADGNFTGYASWAEKPYNRKIWTAIERSRAMAAFTAPDDPRGAPSFRDRVLLLSTTHFGLATPVLNVKREEKADALAAAVVASETAALGTPETLTLHNVAGSRFLSVQLRVNEDPGDRVVTLAGDGLEEYATLTAANGTVFALLRFAENKPVYTLTPALTAAPETDGALSLKTAALELEFDRLRGLTSVVSGGKPLGGEAFLQSFLTYGGKRHDFELLGVREVPVGGAGRCVRLAGAVHLPGEISGGHFCYDFFTVPFSDAVFVKTEVTYPYTPERDSLSSENSTLGRYTDNRWTEAVPFQLTPELGGDPTVFKRNFAGDVSSFPVRSFWEADPRNRTLDSFNHQLTGGFTGLAGDGRGLLLAVQRQVLNSMACCPMRLDANGQVSMNPFGTYYGSQRHHPSRAKGETAAAYNLIAAQSKSIGPAYNGVSETAFMALYGFAGELPTDGVLAEACAFADGAVASAPEGGLLSPFYGDNAVIHTAVRDGATEQKLRSPVFAGLRGNVLRYAVTGTKAVAHIIKQQRKAK